MKRLLNAAPKLETHVQSLLYVYYKDKQSVSNLLDSVTDEDWESIDISLKSIDKRDFLEYLLRKELDETTVESNDIERSAVAEIKSLKTWATKLVIRYALIFITAISIWTVYKHPDEVVPLLTRIIDNITMPSSSEEVIDESEE